MPKDFTLVCATRHRRGEFLEKSRLGRCLATSFRDQSIHVVGFFENRSGLPAVYNRAIEDCRDSQGILVFLHDDVDLLDFFWPERVARALEQFDVVGVAGNRRRAPGQPSWFFIDDQLRRDAAENLSGAAGHGDRFPCHIDRYGPTPAKCQLLDGLFLAVRAQTLHRHGLRFDERFDFHHYDLDFCREATRRGLTLGTCAISVLHESGGRFQAAWRESLRLYRDKWGD